LGYHRPLFTTPDGCTEAVQDMLILGLDFGFLLSLAFQGVLVGFSLDSPNLRKLSIYGFFLHTA